MIYLFINDLIIELNKNAYEVLAYADDLAIIVEGKIHQVIYLIY